MRLAPMAAKALSARATVRTGWEGLAINVATSDMDKSGEEGGAPPLQDAILIAGPTASGKSALALELAIRTGGVIVNADSMQVYSVLDVLTARPPADELSKVPHLLYGHVEPVAAYSTGHYMRAVQALQRQDAFVGRRVIFVGGTGLYFRALTHGLSRMPDVPAEIREKWRQAAREHGAAALHRRLMERDPVAAAAINAADAQRIVRALEVEDASGKPISWWQSKTGSPVVDLSSARLYVIVPDREELGARISRRFDAMLEMGAMEEARAMAALKLDPALPAMKAIGVRELIAADRGEIGLDEAARQAKVASRQYAKRQMTWFRNQLGPQWQRLAIGEVVLPD